MTDEPQATPHEQLEAELAELAVGVLDGRERAVLLDHVESCASCTAELEQLTAAADSLVHLAAEVDPPVGFETRVFDRLQLGGSVTPIRRGWRKRVLVVATAAAVVLAFGIGWAAHPSPGPSGHVAVGASKGDDRLADAPLMSGDRSWGEASVYGGSPAWLFMTVESSTGTGTVWCSVTETDGTTHTIGSFALVSGRGAWDAPLPVAVAQVKTAQLVGAGGRVVATARFS